LFEKNEEKELFDSFKLKNKGDNYLEKMDNLFGLKPQIDNFFDNVMVNVDDEKIKKNRKNLIANIYKAFSDIADIKEISI
jgi:glycyl-tRNA synthetase beta chain